MVGRTTGALNIALAAACGRLGDGHFDGRLVWVKEELAYRVNDVELSLK
jgi:hypothetical protein